MSLSRSFDHSFLVFSSCSPVFDVWLFSSFFSSGLQAMREAERKQQEEVERQAKRAAKAAAHARTFGLSEGDAELVDSSSQSFASASSSSFLTPPSKPVKRRKAKRKRINIIEKEADVRERIAKKQKLEQRKEVAAGLGPTRILLNIVRQFGIGIFSPAILLLIVSCVSDSSIMHIQVCLCASKNLKDGKKAISLSSSSSNLEADKLEEEHLLWLTERTRFLRVLYVPVHSCFPVIP